jgi:hypothetical protein
MGEYQDLLQTLALTLGVAWASGLNLYAAVTVLGLGGATGYIDLPPGLEVVQDPLVILVAGAMYCVEFMADKIPGVDSAWDTLHTFVRIPAGAMLAASAAGPVDPAIGIAAGLLGGTVTAATHAAKTGTRALINTSPEPFSNWTASIAEDAAVLGGLWAALTHPVLFLATLLVFLTLLCFLLPKIFAGLRAILVRLGQLLGFTANGRNRERLEALKRQGVLTDAEYQAAAARL